MSVRMYLTLCCLITSAGLALVGCSKKTDQSPPAAKTSTAQSPSTPQAAPQTAAQIAPQAASQTAPQTITQVSANVAADLKKTVAEIQTQAQAMGVTELRSTAEQYKQAISLKQEDLQKVWAQVKEIPIAQALGEKAKTLKTEIQKIDTSVKSMTERFQVYYNQLKQKGGDLSGLVL